ncbi:MAG: ADP-forming succinate--CoA ligase subunit beta [Rickettsiales bacterium]|nr:ADP-forming succinate--CoA ligase subunit beta [Rickettsiales bacterium]
MNIHEYQAKEVLRKFGVPVSPGKAAFSVEEAVNAAKELNHPLYVVKSQIHAGGRGKGKFKELPEGSKGGVRLAKTLDEVKKHSEEMLGKTLVTIQNGPEGNVVKRLYIEAGSDILNEYYLSLVVDRATSRIAIIASSEGGMDIEEVAHNTPEKIVTTYVDPVAGLQGFHIRKVVFGMGLPKEDYSKIEKVLVPLYKAFIETDCSQIEINPLARIANGEIRALDAKINFDDNALFRHKEIEELRDEDEENPLELRAKKWELSYVKMEGNIGCMVNGAGLAMATMDIIKLNGAQPANFLDVGGGATRERVTEAFKIILADPSVKGILVNIFGGIMKCDIIAEGIIAAAKEVKLSIPLVVRLEGTNVQLGKDILAKSGLAIIPADDLGDAAKKIVAAVK